MRSCCFWLRLSFSLSPSVREVSEPSMPRMLLATTRKRLPNPSRLGSVRLELENSAFSSGRLAIALSSLALLTVRLPSCCISKPTSDSRA